MYPHQRHRGMRLPQETTAQAVSLSRPPRAALATRLLLLLRGFGDQHLLQFDLFRTPRQVLVAIEINLPIDQHLRHFGKRREWMLIEDGQIGVLANLDRTDAIIDAPLFRGIDGKGREW